MTDAVCPRGHLSDDPDFCSECGLRIAAPPSVAPASAALPPVTAPPAAAAPAATPPAAQPCPDCGTPRVPGARFCEVCRHDFAAAAPPGTSAAAMPPPPPPTPAPLLPAFATEAASGNMWIVVGRDPARLDADAPSEPDRAYPLDLAENLVGRRNGRRDLHPEIPVADPSVSARHLKICRRPDGGLYGVDVGSSNGTLLNGAPLSEGVEAPLKAGDVLALGAWTVLTLEAR